MAIIKSFSPFQNLSNFQTFLVDDNPLSDYFRITEFKDTFTGGKNGFLIEGSEFLKETTEVKIELLDVAGNPMYFEPGDGIPEYYEGTSKLVSVHVYDDTPIGLGKITILGELKNYVDGNGSVIPVPSEWKGVYNVKWERTFKVNKNLNNEDIVRFYKRPLVNIDELVKPIFTKSVNQVTDSESTVTGIAQLPNAGTNLSTYRGGTFYKLIKSSGSWDVDVDENTIDVTVNGSSYSPKIIEVLNDREVLVDIPYADNSIVGNFVSQSYSVTYTDFQNETIGESALTGSFAKIDITQLKTFVGDVARVKVFRKSRSSATDFQFVQESRLESTELLRDITTSENTELPYGKFDQTNLEKYWVTSSNDHPVGIHSYLLSQAVKVDYDTNVGGVQQLITSQSFSISKDVEYTLNFRTILSKAITDDKYIKAYFSGSYLNGNGDETQFTQSFIDTTPDGSFVVRKNITENIIAERSIDAKLVFEFKGDDWYISNVSLKNAQDTSFSPDEFTLIQDIPRKLASETFDFRFEFYDINNNYIPVNVIASKTFNGGNDFNTTSKLLTFESDRNAFRYISGSGNPSSQQIQFKTTIQNLTGSITYFSSAFDEDGVYIPSESWDIYPGLLTNPSNNGGLVTISSFEGTWGGVDPKPEVYSIIYTASIEELEEFETVYRLEDGDNAPTLLVSSNANQFIYEPTTLSPKPSGQSITIRAQRKNLATIDTPITINSSSNAPLTYVDTTSGIDTYTISAVDFSASFAQNNFEEVTYEFTGSDVFGVEQSDEITLSKVVNFDGVSIVLSNESVSFPAYSTGLVTASLSPSSGSVQMNIGGIKILHDDISGDGVRGKNTFDITTVVGNGVEPTDTSPIDEFYSIQDFPSASDEGSLTLTIEYLAGDSTTSQSFEKIVSYTKSKAAAPSVALKATPGTQTITSSSIGYEIPQQVEIEVNEGGTEYVFSETLSSIKSYRIQSVNASAGSVEHTNGIITLNTGSGEFNGAQYTALIDYKDSETTVIENKLVKFDLNVNKLASTGSDSKTVKLTASQYRVEYDGDENKVPVEIVLTATSQNIEIPEYKFLRDGIPVTTPEEWSTTPTYTIPDGEEPAVEEVNSWAVYVRELNVSDGDDEVFDNIDIFAVKEGSDAYTIFLTNEVHTFAADSRGEVTSTLADGSFEVRLFRGTVEYDFDESITPADNTYSVSVTSNNIPFSGSTTAEGRRKFTPTTGTWDTSNGVDFGTEVVTITDNANNKVFDRVYTFNKSKKAAPSTLVTLTPQSQTITVSQLASGTANPISVSAIEGTSSYDYQSTLINESFNLSNTTLGTIDEDTITFSQGVSGSGQVEVNYKNSEGSLGSQILSFDIGAATQGISGSNGESGSTGPGIVFRGPWDAGTSYQFDLDTSRRDAVLYNDIYYATLQPAFGESQSPTGHLTDTAYWQSLGQEDFFVAAKIAIFEESFIKNTLNIGLNDAGDTANITLHGNTSSPYLSIGQSPAGVFNANGAFFGTDGGFSKFSLRNEDKGIWWDGETLNITGNLNVGSEVPSDAVIGLGSLAVLDNVGVSNITGLGDLATLDDIGVNEIQNGAITSNAIAEGAISEAKIAIGAITEGKIAANAITANLIAAGAIVADKIAATAITADKIAANAIVADKIAANAITAGKIAAGSVTADKLVANIAQSSNYTYTSGNFSDEGSWLNLTNGDFITPGFSVDGQSGNAYFRGDIAAGANIDGANITGGTLTGGNIKIYNNNIDLIAASSTFTLSGGVGTWSTTGGGFVNWRAGSFVGSREARIFTTTFGFSQLSLVLEANGNIDLTTEGTTGGYVTTTGNITATGNIIAYYSDERLKTNLGGITNPLSKIKLLNGFYYTSNDLAKSMGYTDTDIQVGVSAQEVQKVLPEIVKRAPIDMDRDNPKESRTGDDYLTVQYERMVPLLIEGIKELTNKVEILEEEIKKLKGK